jgi:hypothetical protein
LVLALGFDHVSDDDYARVTIAQAFAHAPRLDPSGTSWLPFPFWALGSVMSAAGRSLAVARVASIAFASLAAALPYVALRMTGVTRGRAMIALGFALLSPWSLWLGAATVPESFTASFTAAAAIALGAGAGGGAGAGAGARLGFALALFAACLSRYEVWPVAAVLAIVLAARGARDRTAREGRFTLVLAAIVALGPLTWMAWNAHAHGDALHFFQRVARFKRALGESSPGTVGALLLYPRLLVAMRPDVLVALSCALFALRSLASRDDARRRWFVPLLCAAAQIVFLAVGNARDGAPAHHSERALLGVVFLIAAFGADVLAEAAPAALSGTRAPARARAFGPLVVVSLVWLVTWAVALRDVPGTGAADDRTSQIATGTRLRDEGARELEITPCAYEHFALIAAYGSPEHVQSRPPAGGAPVAASATCPTVDRR